MIKTLTWGKIIFLTDSRVNFRNPNAQIGYMYNVSLLLFKENIQLQLETENISLLQSIETYKEKV